MSSLPLLFTFRDLIAGRGFYANVEVTGRVLLAEEDGETWMYGVSPGGLAAGGRERAEAFLGFKNAYQAVLFDIAERSDSFGAFKSTVEAFVREVNQPALAEWASSLQAIRDGSVSRDQGLKVFKAEERPTAVDVSEVVRPEPRVNGLDDNYSEAA